jgi:hypothetical protein
MRKTDVLSQAVARDFPYVTFEPYHLEIGAAGGPTAPGQDAAVERFVAGADLVVDATAEYAVGHLLGLLARAHRLPLMLVSSTEGAWGGRVVLLRPNATGCWHCLQRALDDGRVPLPPAEPTGSVQPRGCATRTFTGTSFDLAEVVAQAARTAVRALAAAEAPPGALPAVAVVELHGADGPLPAPRWTTYELPPDAGCELCGGDGH